MTALIAGVLHPLTVPVHVLALLATGLLIGQQRVQRLMAALAAFAVGLLAALIAIAGAVRSWFAADVLMIAAACAGALVALARPLPMPVDAVVAAVTGAALGMDSPPQTVSLGLAMLTLAGTGLGACLALTIVACGTFHLNRTGARIAVRVLGSWIAASAMLGLAARFVRGQLVL